MKPGNRHESAMVPIPAALMLRDERGSNLFHWEVFFIAFFNSPNFS
ncbi:hypothetical protein Thert_00548 [Thermoanaerobacterium thermosaccharolyticum]|uniref:Uncharacterized protein n=1 Tax=Thermoanaerobacterium thermosaccharolyticum TaxID=1517 RepID=A0A223HWR2_THETR|nr:hypothetical protein Thert_00548 [Thermoanaerobacterium thermosaccharolyticum]